MDGVREESSRAQGNKALLPWLSTTKWKDLLPEAVLTISTLCRFIKAFDFTGSYKARTPSMQGGFQAAGIVVSLLMAFAGGTLVGAILKLPVWGDPADENCFEDDIYWEVPEDDESDAYHMHNPDKAASP